MEARFFSDYIMRIDELKTLLNAIEAEEHTEHIYLLDTTKKTVWIEYIFEMQTLSSGSLLVAHHF